MTLCLTAIGCVGCLILDASAGCLFDWCSVRHEVTLRKVAVWRLGEHFVGVDVSISFLYSLSTAGWEFLILIKAAFKAMRP